MALKETGVTHNDGRHSRKEETEIIVASNPSCRVVICSRYSVGDVVGGEMGRYDLIITVVSALSVEFRHWTSCPSEWSGDRVGVHFSVVSCGAWVALGRCR